VEQLFDKGDIDNAFIEHLEHARRIAPADGIRQPAPSRPA
jgi:hypothetical protein